MKIKINDTNTVCSNRYIYKVTGTVLLGSNTRSIIIGWWTRVISQVIKALKTSLQTRDMKRKINDNHDVCGSNQ